MFPLDSAKDFLHRYHDVYVYGPCHLFDLNGRIYILLNPCVLQKTHFSEKEQTPETGNITYSEWYWKTNPKQHHEWSVPEAQAGNWTGCFFTKLGEHETVMVCAVKSLCLLIFLLIICPGGFVAVGSKQEIILGTHNGSWALRPHFISRTLVVEQICWVAIQAVHIQTFGCTKYRKFGFFLVLNIWFTSPRSFDWFSRKRRLSGFAEWKGVPKGKTNNIVFAKMCIFL